jgi:microcystin-dependent protein
MDDAYIGEIRIVPWDWAPEGWLLCNGQLLPSRGAQYTALFAVIQNRYGGDINQFAVPNLNSLAVACAGTGIGLTALVPGQIIGVDSVSLTTGQTPPHTHTLQAGKSSDINAFVDHPAPTAVIGHGTQSGAQSYTTATSPLVNMSPLAVSAAGSSVAHENRQPFLVMNYIICYDGEFPIQP